MNHTFSIGIAAAVPGGRLESRLTRSVAAAAVGNWAGLASPIPGDLAAQQR